MCRKFVGTIAMVALAAAIVGRGGWSYFKTGWGQVVDAAGAAVPLEFEIARARTMLGDLVPEVKKNLVAIAEAEAGLERLDAEIAALETRQTKDKAEITRLSRDVESGRAHFRYAGREYTALQVRDDLSRRFDRHRTADETLENLRKIREARTKSLTAARDKMSGMIATKRQLEVELEQLDSRLKMVQAADTSNRLCLDDGRLSRTKRLLQDLESRLKASERLVALEETPGECIPLEAEESGDVVRRIAEYFARPAATQSVATATSEPDAR